MEKEIRKIVWTLPAKTDLQNIYNFLAEISEIIAFKQIERILNQVDHLERKFVTIGQKEPFYKKKYLNTTTLSRIITRSFTVIQRKK